VHFSVKLQVFKQLEIQTLFMDQANGFSQAEQPFRFCFFFFARTGVRRLVLCLWDFAADTAQKETSLNTDVRSSVQEGY